MAERGRRSAAVARLLSQQPERLATAWRQVRWAELGGKSHRRHLHLDGVVEPFLHELGRSLTGREGSPWSRTRGVLRLMPGHGTRALHDEFATLRRCLLDAVAALGGDDGDRATLEQALDEAVDSAVALLQRLEDARAPGPRVPFGGVVVRLYERARPGERGSEGMRERTEMH